MKINRKYALLVVTALALVALWWVNKKNMYTETFVVDPSRNIMENFNTVQKEEACKALTEQLKTYLDILNKPASTEEETQRKLEVTKAVELMKAEAAKNSCP